jgi:hypothetical protein
MFMGRLRVECFYTRPFVVKTAAGACEEGGKKVAGEAAAAAENGIAFHLFIDHLVSIAPRVPVSLVTSSVPRSPSVPLS